jgi:hypothetical protein
VTWNTVWVSREKGGKLSFPDDYKEIKQQTDNHSTTLSILRKRLSRDGRLALWQQQIQKECQDECGSRMNGEEIWRELQK